MEKFQCQICGKELWETWYASIDFYTYFEDDHPEYFDEIGDYTDAYYENRYETYREHFKKVIKTGLLRQLATYMQRGGPPA